MSDEIEPSMELMFSFFDGIKRKGPGSESSTLKAISMMDHIPQTPLVIEFGCGTGVASLPLVRTLNCKLTAIEIHQPFLDELDSLAAQEGLTKQIKTTLSDMRDPPFPQDAFDIIWCEAAIYNVGFEQGLRRWNSLLRSGGYIAVSEAVWLSPDPPQKVKEFWDSEYPSMTTIDENIRMLSETGFELVEHFILPPEDWENYYHPIQEHLVNFTSSVSDQSELQALTDGLQKEIDVWRKFGDSSAYCFFIARKP